MNEYTGDSIILRKAAITNMQQANAKQTRNENKKYILDITITVKTGFPYFDTLTPWESHAST